jgi:hypothetical protein
MVTILNDPKYRPMWHHGITHVPDVIPMTTIPKMNDLLEDSSTVTVITIEQNI